MPYPHFYEPGEGIARVTCSMCGQLKMVNVRAEAREAWLKGANIQKAMPEVPREERELLISGTCGECWEKLFPPEEE